MSDINQFLDAGILSYWNWDNWLARYDEIDTLKEMVQAGFNVDSQDEYGTTALHNACANGNL